MTYHQQCPYCGGSSHPLGVDCASAPPHEPAQGGGEFVPPRYDAVFTEGVRMLNDDSPPDDIAAPAHYVEGRKYEPRRVAEDWNLNCNAGPALKYLARYERKGDPVGDLKKAQQYIGFEIERLVAEREGST